MSGLIADVAKGSGESLQTLYEHLADKVYSLAYTILQNTFDAEEVTTDVFAQVWAKARQYQADRGKVTTWILIQCRSIAIDLLRKKKRRAEYLRLHGEEFELTDPTATDPQEKLSGLQKNKDLYRELEGLSNDQRQVIHLFYFEGYTQQEIATHLELTLSTVKSHMRRALMTLRQQSALQGEDNVGS